MVIQMNIRDLQIQYDLSKKVVMNNIGTILLRLSFDGTWDNLVNRVVTFSTIPDDKEQESKIISVDYVDQLVEIPSEVLHIPGRLYVSVWGTDESQSTIARTAKMLEPLRITSQGEDPSNVQAGVETTITTFDKMYQLYNELLSLKSELIALRDELQGGTA